MSPAMLVENLSSRGVRVMVIGGKLRVEARRGILTLADKEALAEHKADLLAALTAAAVMPVSERIDGGDMQVVHEGPAIPFRQGDKQPGFHHGDKVGVADRVRLPAGRDDLERLEGVAVEQFPDGFNAHAGSIAQARADSQSDAVSGRESHGVEYKADLLTAFAPGAMTITGMAVSDGLDGYDVAQTDDLHVFRQGVSRLGVENVESQPSNETQARISDVDLPAVGKVNAQGNERLPVQLFGQNGRHHAQSIASCRTDSQGDAQFAYLHRDALDRRVIEAVRSGELHRLSAGDAVTGNVASDKGRGVPEGWTRESWRRRLTYLADGCESDHPDKAAEYRRQAAGVCP